MKKVREHTRWHSLARPSHAYSPNSRQEHREGGRQKEEKGSHHGDHVFQSVRVALRQQRGAHPHPGPRQRRQDHHPLYVVLSLLPLLSLAACSPCHEAVGETLCVYVYV